MQIKNNISNHKRIFAGIVLILIALFAVGIHFYSEGNTVGNDILVFYLAAKSSFLDLQGPYLSENAMLSQLLSYGKLAKPGEDYLTFSYPPFALLPILPFIFFTFDWVQAIWLSILLISLILVMIACFPNSPRWILMSIFLFYPFAFGLLMGNFVIPIAIILFANIKLIFFSKENHTKWIEIILASLLAWATCKPQFSWLFISFILLAAIQQKKFIFIKSFVGALFIYLAASFFILPNWIEVWIDQIKFYQLSNPSDLQLAVILNTFLPENTTKILLPPLVILGVFWVGYSFFKWWKKQFDLFLVFIVIGWMSHLLYPGGVDYRQIVFLIPFILWINLKSMRNPILSSILWASAILISWMEFALFQMMGLQYPFKGWLFAAYLVWAIFVLIQQNKKAEEVIVQPL
ncbi:MAG: hypothetical protein CVU46_15630 [Chloroflexi bacterium HGW-Chloroflexi-8]|jgi:hypothetical protein|nr:MAG: hypothetical protein CVU46_15630 [Chloroflexi bacterium HGW-Chloroflexi-8]